jgi:ComF family protein
MDSRVQRGVMFEVTDGIMLLWFPVRVTMAVDINPVLLACRVIDDLRLLMLNFLLPDICVLCRSQVVRSAMDTHSSQVAPSGLDQSVAALRSSRFCNACIADLPRNLHCCACCGESLPAAAPRCGRCLQKQPLIQSTLAPFRYQAPIDQLILAHKRGGDLAAGRALAGLLAAAAQHQEAPIALVPVPMHVARLRERGFDQVLMLARDVGKIRNLSICDVLVRVRDTPSQGGLKRLERKKNIRGAFATKTSNLPAHVALIDDVATTGSTINECALVLKRAGVQRIDAWVIAKA